MQRKLDLRTGNSVWSAYRAPKVSTGELERDLKADALIVGMGISGAMMAEALSSDGLSVICIDRRGPLLGSTTATTALVQFEIDQPIVELSKLVSQATAERAWQRSRLSVENLKARIANVGISCDLQDRKSLYLAGNVLGPDGLREEVEARRQAGIFAKYLDATALKERFEIDRKGAILSYGNLALDPRKLTSGLLNAAQARGARLFAPVEAVSIEDSNDEVTVATKDGPTVTASHVVLATGYELMDMVPSSEHRVISTWAMATKPQPRRVWPEEAFIWEASDPYLYMRTTKDGRIICGGEDEEFADEDRRDRLLPAKIRRISDKLKRLHPRVDAEPQFSWTGSFGTTRTGLPYMGALPGHDRVFSVQGYGGNGITFSQIASEVVSNAIAGREDTDAKLFAFGRSNILRRIVDMVAS